MQYILQVNTGSFQRSVFTPEQVIARVSQCLERLEVSGVIFGWAADRDVNSALCDLLQWRGIEAYLWLPIFSEIYDTTIIAPFLRADGLENSAIDLCAGENFQFVCPSSPENLTAAFATYAALTKGLPMDGVFLDRIRYPSAANFHQALLGCQCDRCRESYAAAGVDMAHIRWREMKPLLLPESLEAGRYHFADPDVERLFAAKRGIINESVRQLCARFRATGLKVGLDAFAPVVSDFVGQDVEVLGQLVDFIKPMMYRRTYAPAGIPFEAASLAAAVGPAIAERMTALWGDAPLSDETNLRQMTWMQKACGNVWPGIEANRMEGICDATPDYLLRSIAQAAEAGCPGIVLSWDALHMPGDILEALAAQP